MKFSTVEAFVHMDDERHIAAAVVFTEGEEREPTVYVHDRERGEQVGIPLSLFRMMARAVEVKV